MKEEYVITDEFLETEKEQIRKYQEEKGKSRQFYIDELRKKFNEPMGLFAQLGRQK